jgi:lactate racemase
MEYGSRALRDGGVMILLAQCRDGYGQPGFYKWFRFDNLADLESELRRNYKINGQTAYSALQKCKRFRIILVSDQPRDEVELMGITPAVSLGEAVQMAEAVLGEYSSCYVIPDGGAVLPVGKNI